MAPRWRIHVRRLLSRHVSLSSLWLFMRMKCGASESRSVRILSSILSWHTSLKTLVPGRHPFQWPLSAWVSWSRFAWRDAVCAPDEYNSIETCSASKVLGTVCCSPAGVKVCSLSLDTSVTSAALGAPILQGLVHSHASRQSRAPWLGMRPLQCDSDSVLYKWSRRPPPHVSFLSLVARVTSTLTRAAAMGWVMVWGPMLQWSVMKRYEIIKAPSRLIIVFGLLQISKRRLSCHVVSVLVMRIAGSCG